MANLGTRQATSDIALELAVRADNSDDITASEYRRLFIKGLGALLREVDAISYRMKQLDKSLEDYARRRP